MRARADRTPASVRLHFPRVSQDTPLTHTKFARITPGNIARRDKFTKCELFGESACSRIPARGQYKLDVRACARTHARTQAHGCVRALDTPAAQRRRDYRPISPDEFGTKSRRAYKGKVDSSFRVASGVAGIALYASRSDLYFVRHRRHTRAKTEPYRTLPDSISPRASISATRATQHEITAIATSPFRARSYTSTSRAAHIV